MSSILLAGTITIVAPAASDGLGGTAVLNNTASGDFVGYLSKTSGLGGPGIRTSMDDIPEGHGAVFGSFYRSHRPFTFEVDLQPSSSYANSDARYNKLVRAWNALAGDGSITWTDTDGVAKRILFRQEQPVGDPDETGATLLAGVSATGRIESNTSGTYNQASPGTIANAGNVGTPPTFVLTSPTNTITLTNSTTSEVLTLTGLSGAGTVTVDFGARTVTATSGAANRYSAVSFPSSVWWELRPGNNTVAVSGATATNGVRWRDAWLSA